MGERKAPELTCEDVLRGRRTCQQSSALQPQQGRLRVKEVSVLHLLPLYTHQIILILLQSSDISLLILHNTHV